MGFEVTRTRNREGPGVDNGLGSRMRGTGWSNGNRSSELGSEVMGSGKSLGIQVGCRKWGFGVMNTGKLGSVI